MSESRRREPVSDIEDAALEAMKRHRWPGNVRGAFQTSIEGAFTFGNSPTIRVEDFDDAAGRNDQRVLQRRSVGNSAATAASYCGGRIRRSPRAAGVFDEMECDLIRRDPGEDRREQVAPLLSSSAFRASGCTREIGRYSIE